MNYQNSRGGRPLTWDPTIFHPQDVEDILSDMELLLERPYSFVDYMTVSGQIEKLSDHVWQERMRRFNYKFIRWYQQVAKHVQVAQFLEEAKRANTRQRLLILRAELVRIQVDLAKEEFHLNLLNIRRLVKKSIEDDDIPIGSMK